MAVLISTSVKDQTQEGYDGILNRGLNIDYGAANHSFIDADDSHHAVMKLTQVRIGNACLNFKTA